MKRSHIISFSGGAASFATACMVIEQVGKEKVQLVFCDTMIEDKDLYRFINEASEKLEVPLVILRDGRTPWEVFNDKKYQGNTRTAHCTTELKGKMFGKWLRSEFPRYNECVIYFGFDWKEAHRLDTAKRNWAPYWVQSPLIHPPFLSRQQVFQYLDDYDIEIPRLYNLGFSHNNCGGFCVKAGQGHFANLLNKLPEVYEHHEAEQQRLMRLVPNVKPFLRVTIDSKLNYVTLRDFRKMLEAGKEVLVGNDGGCNCFTATDSNGIDEMLTSE